MHTHSASGIWIGTRRVAALVLASIVALTLLFTAQDAMRRALSGGHVDWGQTFALNGLDWVVWGLLLPFVVLVASRIRLDGSGSTAFRIVGWLLLAVAFCTVQSVITGLIIRNTDPRFFGLGAPRGAAQRPLGSFLLNWGLATSSFNLLIFGMTAGAFHAALYYRDLRTRQLREAALEARLASAELEVLRMQLQPHFLFNALHTVSSLMLTDVPTAQHVVSALGDLLRASLEHTARQEVPLGDELSFVERYLDIQRARFRQRLQVDVDVADVLRTALVPSLVLQPLVENAIRHGIEPSSEGARMRIAARRDGEQIVLTVENDGPPNGRGAADAGAAPGRAGVGLANVEARLAQLYGSAHAFRAGWNGDGHFTVTLTLPCHTEPDLFPAPDRAAAALR